MLSILFTLTLLSISFCAEQELAFFEGRSGQIILEPQNTQDDSILLFWTKGDSEKLEGQQLSIDDTSIADMISHAVGGPVIK